MENKITIIVLTALLFILMAVVKFWFGVLCMGAVFVLSLMSFRVNRK